MTSQDLMHILFYMLTMLEEDLDSVDPERLFFVLISSSGT